MRDLELLAPAADKNVAREAILHGADAVYMGGPSHGARKKASNSLADIRETVEFAHRFRARVYVTVNTLVYPHEIREVERLVWNLYLCGVDAIIVQDMSLLRMNLPPIALHASTQCDTRTPEKALFLQEAGFSQIVLARELSLQDIDTICRTAGVPVECFIHGALCVSYSGRCAASQVSVGRSANRGECAQMCRMPYTLRNGRGEVVERDKYLLSLRDFNASELIPQMIEAGVTSFKIEGRLKEADYVKNVTAAYRAIIDKVIASNPGKYRRSSYGESKISFTPRLDKSFNRGFTDYFLNGRKPASMASLLTPKSMGEIITDTRLLHNGDGISFFNTKGEYEGVGVNRVENGRIIGSRPFRLPPGTEIHRTSDREWLAMLARGTASRTVAVDITLTETAAHATDERGVSVSVALQCDKAKAEKPMDPRAIFAKLGNTVYRLREFRNELDRATFIPASQLTALRRRLTDALDACNSATYRFDMRRIENKYFPYPCRVLDKRDNVANHLAESFYRDHKVQDMAYSVETKPEKGEMEVMTTRYCIRRELGCCLKQKIAPEKRARYEGPLSITTGPHRFSLRFNCVDCEMSVVRESLEK